MSEAHCATGTQRRDKAIAPYGRRRGHRAIRRAYRTGTPLVRNFCARAVRGMRRPSPPVLPVPAGW